MRGESLTEWRKQTNEERKKLAQKLRLARAEAGLTQREVVKRLNLPSHSLICELENGQRRLDMVELKVLARLYCKEPDWFLSDD